MKKTGDRVRVIDSQDYFYNRVGTLLKMTEVDFYEVCFESTPRYKEESVKIYHDKFLEKVVSYEEWQKQKDGSTFINWEFINTLTEEEANEMYNGFCENFL